MEIKNLLSGLGADSIALERATLMHGLAMDDKVIKSAFSSVTIGLESIRNDLRSGRAGLESWGKVQEEATSREKLGRAISEFLDEELPVGVSAQAKILHRPGHRDPRTRARARPEPDGNRADLQS
jgi:hypothetical protein